jgi:HEAT repeat protein
MKKLATVLVLVLPLMVACEVTTLLRPPAGPVFRGMTGADWEREIDRWQWVELPGKGIAARGWRAPVYCVWLAKLGLRATAESERRARAQLTALQESGPSGVPVLIELLKSSKVSVRRFAAQALMLLASVNPESARPAVPALVVATEDVNEYVRCFAELALLRIQHRSH